MRRSILFAVNLLVVLSLLAACVPTPEVVEKVVTQVVEKDVEVPVEVTRIVEGTPVVETVVETVIETVVEEKEVEVVVTATPVPRASTRGPGYSAQGGDADRCHPHGTYRSPQQL